MILLQRGRAFDALGRFGRAVSRSHASVRQSTNLMTRPFIQRMNGTRAEICHYGNSMCGFVCTNEGPIGVGEPEAICSLLRSAHGVLC